MRNPKNRTLDSTSFVASYPENRASVGAATTTTSSEPDTCTRRKRVRFAQGNACLLESESGAKATLSDVDNPKTSEYAFFKKLRKDAGKPSVSAQKKRNNTDGCKSGDGSGVGNRISQCFQNLKFSLHTQDVKQMNSCSLLSPIAGPSKATGVNYVEQLENSEFAHPIKKVMHVDFNASCSPFRDRVKSAVASYVYGQGTFFSAKRDKLLQLVTDTYPGSKDLNLNGKDLVNSMLSRLFPNDYDRKHARKLRQQDACASWLTGYQENTADCEKLSWPGYNGLTEAGDLLLLDYGRISSDSTELVKWSGEYSISPDQSTEYEQVHHKTNKPYIIRDYVRNRSPWMKHHQSSWPCEKFLSHNLISNHPKDVPSRHENLLLGWIDEETEDEDHLQIAPYKLHSGKSLHSNCQALLKNDYQLEPNRDFSLSQIPPQSVHCHYSDMNSYFETMENTDSYIASDHLIEDKETKDWDTDILHCRGSGSYFTNNDGVSRLPFMNSHLLSTPSELISSDYPKGHIMCIEKPCEVCGNKVFNYLTHDCHRNRDGGYQIGYTDEPIYDQTTTYSHLPF